MTDLTTRVRFYLTDPTVIAMGTLGVTGVALAGRVAHPIVLPLVALGWGLYLVQEHLVHRFIFHAPAPRRQRLFDLLYRLHYGHHDQVHNRHLLFTPLWFTLPLTALNVAVVWVVVPLDQALVAVLAGGVPAYLLFEWLHLGSHCPTRSKGRLRRFITRRHAKHHFIDHTNWYTVSPGGQTVDQALGCDPDGSVVIPNARTCGLDPDDPRLHRSRERFGHDQSLARSA